MTLRAHALLRLLLLVLVSVSRVVAAEPGFDDLAVGGSRASTVEAGTSWSRSAVTGGGAGLVGVGAANLISTIAGFPVFQVAAAAGLYAGTLGVGSFGVNALAQYLTTGQVDWKRSAVVAVASVATTFAVSAVLGPPVGWAAGVGAAMLADHLMAKRARTVTT